MSRTARHAPDRRLLQTLEEYKGRILLLALIGVFAILSIGGMFRRPHQNAIELPVLGTKKVTAAIIRTANFNGLSKQEILGLREKVVEDLFGVGQGYVPSEDVFGGINDGDRWWSFPEFYGAADRQSQIDGDSVESLAIMNPWLLVVPEFWGLTAWINGRLKLTPDADFQSTLYRPKLTQLSADLKNKVVSATFDVSDFLRERELLDHKVGKPANTNTFDFGVSGYNAIDFGYRFTMLRLEKSIGIANPKAPKGLITFSDRLISAVGLCYPQIACNHRMLSTPALDSLKVTKLPAKAVFTLWKWWPKNVAGPGDLTFELIFE